jgi:hypothetical protein
VEGHYRYEDMPEYRDREVVKKLAEQRKRTMKAISDALRDAPPAWYRTPLRASAPANRQQHRHGQRDERRDGN